MNLVRVEIRDRHLAAREERRQLRGEPEQDDQTADHFDDARHTENACDWSGLTTSAEPPEPAHQLGWLPEQRHPRSHRPSPRLHARRHSVRRRESSRRPAVQTPAGG